MGWLFIIGQTTPSRRSSMKKANSSMPMLQFIKNIRSDKRPQEHQNPNPSLKNIIIRQEFLPWMADDEVAENEFESNRQDDPYRTDDKRFFGGSNWKKAS